MFMAGRFGLIAFGDTFADAPGMASFSASAISSPGIGRPIPRLNSWSCRPSAQQASIVPLAASFEYTQSTPDIMISTGSPASDVRIQLSAAAVAGPPPPGPQGPKAAP